MGTANHDLCLICCGALVEHRALRGVSPPMSTLGGSGAAPRYRTVLSILCPAGHSIDYVPCRTMSRRSTIPFVINASGRAARDIVHGCHRALRKASNLSSGRMPLLQCNVAIRINPLDKENYVQRAQRQRAVRSAQLATTGHSPARDIVDAPMPEQ